MVITYFIIAVLFSAYFLYPFFFGTQEANDLLQIAPVSWGEIVLVCVLLGVAWPAMLALGSYFLLKK